jgi:hypothetical protein
MENPPVVQPKFSIPSIIAIVAAIASFATGALIGFILAMIAVFFGVIGFLISLSPRHRGGLVSVLGVTGGILGVIAAVFKGLAYFF